ncbi:NACHT domain-containing protein [Streptomyces sp. NPDC026206]|uniref:NACHT domain-containing protein n=1 Tax=Streptomyces sp. NPDC026206 TaxID=3157089 RepID=UPI0033E8317A
MADESRIHNVMQGTAEYVLQIGHVRGDVTVHLPPAADPVERAAWSLARSVRAQWAAEVNAWDLASAEPLSVRWQARWPGRTRDCAVPHADQIARVADAFLGLGHRRLVVLGEPGAGKSTLAVLLALELAERCLPARRTRDDGTSGDIRPVPVVLTLESWDPSREHFRSWLARRIAEDYPGLPQADGKHPAARLVQDRRILPVLDGLDELPEHRRPAVVREIDRALGEKDAVVLTCRTREYRAGEEAGASIARAAVMEAQPVGLQEATAYLLHCAVPQARRNWKLMLDAVDQEPDGPVAQALTSPLMIWLARRGFRTPPADPRDLVRRPFASREAVEKHLLDLIIPAVFAQQPHAPDRLHAPRQWNEQRSRHWLAHLAGHLSHHRTTELAWWELHRTPLVRVMMLPALLLACLALAKVAAVSSDWLAAEYTRSSPLLGKFGESITRLGLQTALTGGLVHASAVWVAVEAWFGYRRGQPRRRANPFRIGAALRSAGRAASVGRALKASAVIIVPTALFTSLALATSDPRPYVVMVLCSTGLAPLLMVTIAAPSDTEDASTPDEVLRSERTAAWLSVCTVAVLIGIGQGAIGWYSDEPSKGLAKAAAGWFGASAMLLLLSLWSRWVLAKGCLAIAGRVPWSLMEFLRDAHHGGLLQRSGGVYRFRHLRLQEHLASGGKATRPGGPAPLPPPHPAPLLPPHPAPPPGTRSPGPPGASPPGTRLRDLVAEAERSPLSSRKGWTVQADEHSFRAAGRQRRFPLGHWPGVLFFAAIIFIRSGVQGQWLGALVAAFVWCCIGVLIMLVAWLLPPRTQELCMTGEHIEFAVGRRRGRLAWTDVQDVAVRKLIHRKRDTKTYAVHVRPRPGAPLPARYFRGGDGWYFVLPLSPVATVPADLAAALQAFAGTRWRPPVGDIAPQGGRVTVHNEVSGQARAGTVVQAGDVHGDVTLGKPDSDGTGGSGPQAR